MKAIHTGSDYEERRILIDYKDKPVKRDVVVKDNRSQIIDINSTNENLSRSKYPLLNDIYSNSKSSKYFVVCKPDDIKLDCDSALETNMFKKRIEQKTETISKQLLANKAYQAKQNDTSDVITNKIRDIKELITSGSESIKNRQAEVNTKEMLIIIGDTGVGKSVLANYLCGKELIAEKDLDDPDKFVIGGGSGISHKPLSETSVPNLFTDKDRKLVYCDCPGFGDTKGDVQDIANAFYIKKFFDDTNKIKLILVIRKSDLDDRMSNFLNIVKKLTNLLGDVDKFKDGLLLVVTKSSQNFSRSNITNKMDELLSKGADVGGKLEEKFIKFMASNKSGIQIFKTPTTIGKLDTELREKIMSSILDSRYINGLQANIAVSSESKLLVKKMSETIIEGIKNDNSTFISNINLYCSDEVIKYCMEDPYKLLASLDSLHQITKDLSSSLDKLRETLQYSSKKNKTDINKSIVETILRSVRNIDKQFAINFINSGSLNDICIKANTDIEYLEFCLQVCPDAQIDYPVPFFINELNTLQNDLYVQKKKIVSDLEKEINEQIEINLEELISKISNYISTKNLNFDGLANFYKSLKHKVIDQITLDIKKFSQEKVKSLDIFKQALLNLKEKIIDENGIESVVLDKIECQIDKLYILKTLDSNIGYNIINFQIRLNSLIKEYEHMIQEKINGYIDLIKDTVAHAVGNLSEYYRKIVVDENLETSINKLKKTYEFFLNVLHTINFSNNKASAAVVQLTNITDISEEKITEGEGLITIGYTLSVLKNIKSGGMIGNISFIDSNIKQIEEKIKSLCNFIKDADVSFAKINASSINDVLGQLSQQVDIATDTYVKQSTKHITIITKQVESFIEQFFLSLSSYENASVNNSKKILSLFETIQRENKNIEPWKCTDTIIGCIEKKKIPIDSTSLIKVRNLYSGYVDFKEKQGLNITKIKDLDALVRSSDQQLEIIGKNYWINITSTINNINNKLNCCEKFCEIF